MSHEIVTNDDPGCFSRYAVVFNRSSALYRRLREESNVLDARTTSQEKAKRMK